MLIDHLKNKHLEVSPDKELTPHNCGLSEDYESSWFGFDFALICASIKSRYNDQEVYG